MGQSTKIEWTDATWNPLRARDKATGKVGWHCTKPSAGCKHCYAETLNKRLGTGHPFTVLAGEKVEVFLDEKMLDAPLRWRKPKRIFVNSMTDTFAEFMLDEMIADIFLAMALGKRHTYQVLTKRSSRLRKWMNDPFDRINIIKPRGRGDWAAVNTLNRFTWPLPNVWLGVSAEDQANADARIPDLLATPAAVRFVSAEPLLGPLDLSRYLQPHWTPGGGADRPPWLDWVIVGGESGHGARPMQIEWVGDIVRQCHEAGVPVFVKQVCERGRKVPFEQWPEDIRVRQFPSCASGEDAS